MDYTKPHLYTFSTYNPRKEYKDLKEEEREILGILTNKSTFGYLLLKTGIERTILTFTLVEMVKRKLVRADRMDYPCEKCSQKCCRLGECSTFPCERIKEGCNKLYEYIISEKAKGRIK